VGKNHFLLTIQVFWDVTPCP